MASMFDHVTLTVSDYARSKAFYEKALAPLGIAPIKELEHTCGFGRGDGQDFWIGTGPASFQKPEDLARLTPTHIAFAARSREEVHAFYEAALAAGAKDYGAPGLRPHYHPSYYGAFVLDPDGNDIEAVFHDPV
ncbi:Lactoylglutathione lyase [Minicystis rosea]|nr:Lactoylglutathione lyase [Minicystis rosea]